MIIKRFQGATEQEAILKAKEEMGGGAVVLSTKVIKHKGLSRLFKKDYFEITAALEDKVSATGQIPYAKVNETAAAQAIHNPNIISEPETSAIEEKLNNLQAMFASQMLDNNKIKEDVNEIMESEEPKKEKNINFSFIRLVYSQLLDNEVDEKYANQIIGEIETSIKKETNVDSILSSIYQKIILKIGQPKVIEPEEKKTKIVFFVGPTGVGKTTTIAKLASFFKLEKKLKVAMITSDTYRIAAVEQLRTYANILDVPLQVIYTIEEFNNAVKNFEGYDLIFVDTAGRSHKNDEQCKEVFHLINDCTIDEEKCVKETYLVLSAATKYRDLIKITDTFETIKDYSILFTKLDETSCLGNILNIRLKTGAALSYVTSGQVVPDDISSIDAQKIARNLLGGSQ
ncbi:MAG: flagellar biosynthesis protein FlhF [Lachnospiraceae bacterium]|nr:flagellar biosynthesis protein FlhF [Lachnospiraceae bacterium]